MGPLVDRPAVCDAIARHARVAGRTRAVLVALTGIDGCGKGYVAEQLKADLEQCGIRAAAINIDGWLNLPSVRFSSSDPAEHFYAHAIRFADLFRKLVFPLVENRCVDVVYDFAEETAHQYRPEHCVLTGIDVVIVEGIYLLKREFQGRYDIACWMDCSFETALERAVARAQEGLPPGETARAYERIYFPAQRIHIERDQPRTAAEYLIGNDPRTVS